MVARVRVRGVNRTILRLKSHRTRARVGLQRNAPAIRRRLIRMTRRNFASESDSGDRWVPLSPDYAARKKGPQILIETGEMFRSLVSRTAHSIWRVSAGRIVWGTRDPKAKYHQHYNVGTNPPGRPFMPRPRRAVRFIARRIRNYIVGRRP